MLQIRDTLVSLDLIDYFFICDLEKCLGACCIEGDAGAPVTREEIEKINAVLPEIKTYLTPAATKEIEENGTSYIDEEGELVTNIVNGADCVFTTFEKGGLCLCALEKAYNDGKIPYCKPSSCQLYPVRLKEYAGFTAVNLHHWKICKSARKLGMIKGVRAYQFLKQPLIRKFGQEWYDELDFTAKEYLRQKATGEL